MTRTRTSAPARIEFLKFHEDQRRVYKALAKVPMGRFVLRAGRRYGKTTLFEQAAAKWAVSGEKVGWFSPNYKLLLPSFKRILKLVKPMVISASRIDGLIELVGGGLIEFWTLNDEDAGRSRNYDRVIIDEAGLVKKGLKEIWEQAIEPTLLDRGGSAYMAGTPKGVNLDSFFYLACTDKALGWEEFHVPTHLNPTLHQRALAELESRTDPMVFLQEYKAEFVDWRGVAFFARDKWLDADGKPFPYPKKCDMVYATIDTAVKDGKKHDGTAIIYWSLNRHPLPGERKLMILDWDLIQVEGATLENWLPSVYVRLAELSNECGARYDTPGPFIEDKASGTILLQQARRRGWRANAISNDLTEMGKDGRALSVSGYHYSQQVGISQHASDKRVKFKGETRNHLETQVCGYVMGDEDAYKRADDLADTYTYGLSIGLGNYKGH